MTSEKTIAGRLLAVIRDVYEEGQAVVGERWVLFKKMTEMADRNDAVGMLRYFEECLRTDRGKRVGDKLCAAGKKSLESEAWRVWAAIGEELVEARITYMSGVRDAERRRRLEESFDVYWRSKSIIETIGPALEKRLRRKQGVMPLATPRKRLDALPFVFIRHTGPEFDRAQSFMEQAGVAYLLGLFEGSAAVGRAALEIAVADRWRSVRHDPPPRERTPDRLTRLLEGASLRAVPADLQTSRAQVVKKTGDAAAHGEEVSASRALSALLALRRLFGEFYW